jgi:regulator of protease activity HflC (stomatin/prohibitin superfamily)
MVRQRVQARLQGALDELATGVEVVQVVAYTIEPGAVRPAFMDVVRAENERLSLQEKAEEEAAEILNRAASHMHRELLDAIGRYGEAQLKGDRPPLTEIDQLLDRAKQEGAGEVAVKLSEAEARADQTNERLRSEFEEFNNYLEQRRARPRITVLDLWVQMRHAILSNRLNEIFFVPHSNEIEILIKSDPQRKIELEEEAARKRQSGEK